MSQDSLINDDENGSESIPVFSFTMNQTVQTPTRPVNLDEHIKLVKQKKEEVDVIRLQRFQEQLRKKDEKWQQQQVEKVKKWLQLRHRDSDHRLQVEERRKKREEEDKAKIDEILRREKEREQRNHFGHRANSSFKPDPSLFSSSIDVLSTRRAISAPRIRSNHQNMTHRRASNDSPINTSADNSATAISSHPSPRSDDVTMTNEDSSLLGTPRSSAPSRTRPMPTSYAYWLNSGDNSNQGNANFMRLTYAASCRSRLSRSVERCPRACRGHEDSSNNAETRTKLVVTTNGEPQPRPPSISRQHLNETIRRLSQPKHSAMTQSTHLGATSLTSSSNGFPFSQSSHQLRVPTPPVPTTNHTNPTPTRRRVQSRPATAPSHRATSATSARASPTHDTTSENHPVRSSTRHSSHRTVTQPKLPLPPSSKPPTSSSSTLRSKPPVSRSLMTTSYSSSSLSSPTTTKQNVRRVGGVQPGKEKPVETPDQQVQAKDNEEETITVTEDTHVKEEEEEEKQTPAEVQPSTPPVEPINIDTITDIINSTGSPISKREQQLLEEQEYQRKLNQKIREAQQRLEAERQLEEERQRQAELEEYEREQEQIRLEKEQRRVEDERLQRAIEERERENDLKRQEEQRLQQQREESERKQAEETERLTRERQDKAKKEEEERNERKKRLDSIMRRTRQVSPSPKPENNISKTNLDEFHENDLQTSLISHSISDLHFPTSSSTDNLSNHTDSPTPEPAKFKSPLIQNLLNKARNSRSTDNLSQSAMSTSQLMTESMMDDGTITKIDLSDDDDDQQDSGINNTLNGHADLSLSSSTNLNSYHDRPIETATAFQ